MRTKKKFRGQGGSTQASMHAEDPTPARAGSELSILMVRVSNF